MPPPAFKPVPLFGGALTANMPADFADVSDIRQIPDNQEVYLATNGFTSVTIDLCERVEAPPTRTSASPQSSAAAAASSSSVKASTSSSGSAAAAPSTSSADGAASTDPDTNPNIDDNEPRDPNHYALAYHFFDIVASEDTKRIHSTTHNIRLPHFPSTTPISSLLATTTPPPKERARNEASWVGVIMTLIRLVGAETDMLVVVNVPCVPGEEVEEVVDFERGVFGKGVDEGKAIMEGVLGSLRVVDWGLFGNEGGAGEGRSG